jgi:hypothetical protein
MIAWLILAAIAILATVWRWRVMRSLSSISSPATSSSRGRVRAGLTLPAGGEVPSPPQGREGAQGTHAGKDCPPLAPKSTRRDPAAALACGAAAGRGKGREPVGGAP